MFAIPRRIVREANMQILQMRDGAYTSSGFVVFLLISKAFASVFSPVGVGTTQ